MQVSILSINNTIVLVFKFWVFCFHLDFCCSWERYYLHQRFQSCWWSLCRYWSLFIFKSETIGSATEVKLRHIKKCAGVNTCMSFGSEESRHNGQEFRAVSICARTVSSSSNVKADSYNTIFKLRLMDLTPASQRPPKLGV